MASLLSRLPAPVHAGGGEEAPAAAPAGAGTLARVGGPPPPPYGSRQGWVPRKAADFADGGAYPECHVAQYPLDCGRKGASAGAGGAKSGTVAVTVKEDGSVDYSALVKQGSNANKTVATAHNALVPKLHDMTEEVRRPRRAVAARNACTLQPSACSHARGAGPGPPGAGGGGRHACRHQGGHRSARERHAFGQPAKVAACAAGRAAIHQIHARKAGPGVQQRRQPPHHQDAHRGR